MKIEFIDSLANISADAWNSITGRDYPFTRHEFLYALERTGCTDRASGWQPLHALIKRGHELIGVMPLYLKTHSYGEYVFDWSWAEAYQRYGLDYYPKLLAAIPFTPATGPRLCIAPGEDRAEITTHLLAALRQKIAQHDYSSLHILFPHSDETGFLKREGLSERSGVQYHWFNQNFASFDDFLAICSSRKRKNLRKERERVYAQGIELTTLTGAQIQAREWDLFYHFYVSTYAKRSGHGGYLNQAFFRELGTHLPEHMVMTLAHWRGETIAGALYFRDSSTLYGRYWGCVQELDCLHFEACYYRGIDYCIENHLARFDPGAQGEHKIQRGFTPIKTVSYHWIENQNFRRAIDDFLIREHAAIDEHIVEASALLPFKHNSA